MPIQPPRWSADKLREGRRVAIEQFRAERIAEPLDQYLTYYEDDYAIFSDIMELTDDLRRLRETQDQLLTNKKRLDLCRYIASPPLSADDLSVLADTKLSLKALRANPDAMDRVTSLILAGLDRERFPWVGEDREPTEAERYAATMATAAMIAFRKVETWRRNYAKKKQEQELQDYLREELGFKQVGARPFTSPSDGPQVGEFCAETKVGSRKADVTLRLFDKRLMPVECKVSNSETNSYKRINNDAAKKAETWRKEFGENGVVPAAVMSGVYATANLEYAQSHGLTLFWAHDLGELGDFIRSTR